MLERLRHPVLTLRTWAAPPREVGNAYNRRELAGAFGDLGTLIPFLIGYIAIAKVDPAGLLVAFGLTKILVGLYYRTPIPVQPMKAVGGAAIVQAGVFSPGMIFGSGLFLGLFWLAMALSGSLDWVARITTKPVIRGIMLGLGLRFLLDGVLMMAKDPLLALPAAALTLLLLTNERMPAMLALLAFGIGGSLWREPAMLGELGRLAPSFHLPELGLRLSWSELLSGALLLGLAQIPLTLSNAIIATAAEHNALFPERPLGYKRLAITTALMNLISPLIGGVPMCHGAGGLAGHVRFGARTGGALVILGAIVLFLGLFFRDSVLILLGIFPEGILGVILAFAGAELASVIRDIRGRRENTYVLVATAGIAMWHMGYAFLAGLALYWAIRRGIFQV